MNTIPDPVALGLVQSLARPGGNVTGVWTAGGIDALTSKRIGLLKEVVPGLSRMGVVIVSGDLTDAIILQLLPTATRALGLTYEVFEVSTSSSTLHSRGPPAKGCRAYSSVKIPFSLLDGKKSRRLRRAIICRRSMAFASTLRPAD